MKLSITSKLLATTVMLVAIQYPNSSYATPVVDKLGTGVKFSQTGSVTTVTQSGNLVTNTFKSLDTSSGETLNFVLPNSDAISINKVTSGQVTNFQGILNSTIKKVGGATGGHIVIQNDAGVTFAAGSQINVGSLVATTAKDITRNSNGSFAFKNISDAALNFDGTVTTNSYGYVFGVANHISVGESGSINSLVGKVTLAGGSDAYTVTLKGSPNISYSTKNDDKSDIKVLGQINAGAGSVLIQAKANDIYSGVINLDGMVDVSNDRLAGNVSLTGNNINVASTGKIHATGKIGNNVARGMVTLAAKKEVISNGEITAEHSISAKNSDKTAKGSVVLNGTYNAQQSIITDSQGDVVLNGDFTTAALGSTSKGNTSLDGNINIFATNGKIVRTSVGHGTNCGGETGAGCSGYSPSTYSIQTYVKVNSGGDLYSNAKIVADGGVNDPNRQLNNYSNSYGATFSSDPGSSSIFTNYGIKSSQSVPITLVAKGAFIDGPDSLYKTNATGSTLSFIPGSLNNLFYSPGATVTANVSGKVTLKGGAGSNLNDIDPATGQKAILEKIDNTGLVGYNTDAAQINASNKALSNNPGDYPVPYTYVTLPTTVKAKNGAISIIAPK